MERGFPSRGGYLLNKCILPPFRVLKPKGPSEEIGVYELSLLPEERLDTLSVMLVHVRSGEDVARIAGCIVGMDPVEGTVDILDHAGNRFTVSLAQCIRNVSLLAFPRGTE